MIWFRFPNQHRRRATPVISNKQLESLAEISSPKQEDVLQMTSLLFLAYAKAEAEKKNSSKNKAKAPQEIQAMALDGHMLVSGNSSLEFIDLVDFFGKKKSRIEVAPKLSKLLECSLNKIKTMDNDSQSHNIPMLEKVVAEFSERCSLINSNTEYSKKVGIVPRLNSLKNIEDENPNNAAIFFRNHDPARLSHEWLNISKPGQIHVLSGDGEIHAEQTLLLALANRLFNGLIPTRDVVIRGTKPPCSTCLKVLTAFKKAYQLAYEGRKLEFDATSKGRNNDKAVLSLSDFKDCKDLRFETLKKYYCAEFPDS
ncbi:hypothetical protein JYK02_35465 [Corallococcus macrosporus]|uniref:CMP/dCMP-type deaminase domain-containing protein n=1 Tax=Corallococcus macrosporus TaxID=35 RepID=A0ABS3DNB5_9BACT|nr:hypothetical protein [Corallococcus macrosporus]MBN8232829.1 hypothetical protein [Corallococcus macrosporus]